MITPPGITISSITPMQSTHSQGLLRGSQPEKSGLPGAPFLLLHTATCRRVAADHARSGVYRLELPQLWQRVLGRRGPL